jgi:hypothetical protein
MRMPEAFGCDVIAMRAFNENPHLTIAKHIAKKKEQDRSPALKIVSTLFSPKKLDLSFVRRGDAACARQGSSRDLDHQPMRR